jgi:hypothetical protein
LHINHNKKLRKKKATPFGSTIITFFGSTHIYKHRDETQQQILEDLVLTFAKVLSTCKNIWHQRLVIHQCFGVNFPFRSNLVEHVLLEMVQKTMDLHVLPILEFATAISTSFIL